MNAGQFKARHGETRTRLYGIWVSMRHRGTRKHRKACYVGVTHCPEWDDYAVFAAWAYANGYTDELTLDRREPDKRYEPDNCRWVTYTVQNRNRRSCRFKDSDIPAIFQMRAIGMKQREIAVVFNCNPAQISAILSGRRWANK